MPKTTSKANVVKGVLYIFFLGVCLSFGAIAGWIGSSEVGRALVGTVLAPKSPQKVFQDSHDNGKSLTVLILGCDEDLYYRGTQVLNAHARSDMMMVARLDFDRNLVGAVSIPRDTLCRLPGYASQKINAYNKIGGPELAKAAVEEILPGVHIDRVVTLNFEAFQEVIDMLGGVDVYVPRDMKYTDTAAKLYIDLKKGRQHLNGYDAMCFVRWRKNQHGGGDSDFERQKRQKDLMLALKQQLIKNWTQGMNVLDKTVEISGNAFNAEEVATLMMFMKALGDSSEKIRMGQIPVNDIEGTYDLAVDNQKLQSTLEQYLVVPTDSIPSMPSENQ